MQHTKQQKELLIAEVTQRINDSKALVFANFKGVSVKNITTIRKELRKSGSSWQVLKKTPTIRAAFHGFDVDKVAAMTDKDIEKLLTNEGVIRRCVA